MDTSTIDNAYLNATGTFVEADWVHDYVPLGSTNAADPSAADYCTGDGSRDCQVCVDVKDSAVAAEEHAADAMCAVRRGDWPTAVEKATEAAALEYQWGDDPTWWPFVEAIRLTAVEALGRKCAEETIRTFGPDSMDVDGGCLLPPEPVGWDWDALDGLLDRYGQATQEEEAAFTEAYKEVMDPAIERVVDGVMV